MRVCVYHRDPVTCTRYTLGEQRLGLRNKPTHNRCRHQPTDGSRERARVSLPLQPFCRRSTHRPVLPPYYIPNALPAANCMVREPRTIKSSIGRILAQQYHKDRYAMSGPLEGNSKASRPGSHLFAVKKYHYSALTQNIPMHHALVPLKLQCNDPTHLRLVPKISPVN